MVFMARVYVAMGSNLGDRQKRLEAAHAALDALPRTRCLRLSPVYETAAVGGPAGQRDYLNAVAELETSLAARDLLERLQRIEQEAGREPVDQRVRWGPRVLDLDLLLYDDAIIREKGLSVPHPRMHERWFVLKPLTDLAPNLVHPVLGRTIRDLLEQLEQSTPGQEPSHEDADDQ